MIAVFSKKFCFFKIPGNASGSITEFFMDNLVTLGDQVNCSYPLNRSKFDGLNYIISLDTKEVYATPTDLPPLRIASEETMSDLNGFAIVRDPVDRFICMMYKVNRKHLAKGIDYMIEDFLDSDRYVQSQTKFLKYQDKLLSNVYSYPNIQMMLDDALDFLGIGAGPKLNYTYNSKFRPNKSINIKQSLKDNISELYKEDLEIYQQIVHKEAQK